MKRHILISSLCLFVCSFFGGLSDGEILTFTKEQEEELERAQKKAESFDWTKYPIALQVIAESLKSESGKRRKIRVILVGAADTSLIFSNVEEWKHLQAKLILAYMEKFYLLFFKSFDNIDIIDRGNLDKILEEQRLSMTGAIDIETAIKAGKIAGGTHLIIWNLLQAPYEADKETSQEIYTRRLIEIETGKILASYFQEFRVTKDSATLIHGE